MVEKEKRNIIIRIILQAARLPLLYLLLSLSLIALSYVDDYFPLEKWGGLFDYANQLGSILFALAATTFIYNIIVMECSHYEKLFRDKHQITALILASLRKNLGIVFVLITLKIIIPVVIPSKFYLNLANNIINPIIICAIAWIIIQILHTFEAVIYQYMLHMTRPDQNRLNQFYTKVHIIKNIATVLIVIITLAAVLMSFSSVRNIGISLLASAGFLTAIVGLASQKTLFLLFSGVQIALSQTIKIGDIIVIENASGVVEEITFTYVILKLSDNRRLIVPINFFIEKPFENWSTELDGLRSSFSIFIDYMMPIDPLRKELDTILKNSNYWDGKAKKLETANITERGVELRVQISASNETNLAELRAEVREKLLEFMRNQYPNYFPKFHSKN